MAGRKSKPTALGGKEEPRKHHCPAHGEECKSYILMPKRKLIFHCSQGCELTKRQTVLK